MSTPEQKIQELKLHLPTPAKPMAKYKPTVLIGNTLYVSGHGPANIDAEASAVMLGKVGTKLTRDQGKRVGPAGRHQHPGHGAACPRLARQGGTARQVARRAWSTRPPTSSDHPFVINGFSELMAEVFGDDAGVGRPRRRRHGRGSRATFPVEIECILG